MTDLLISVPEGSSVQVIVNGHALTAPGVNTDSDNQGYVNEPWDLRACYDNSYIEEVSRLQRANQPQGNKTWDLRACDDASFIDDLTHGRLRE